jgi:hypothetical protein
MQATIPGERAITMAADDGKSFNSLHNHQSLVLYAMPFTYISEDMNSETPEWSYVIVFSSKDFSNKGIRHMSSTFG